MSISCDPNYACCPTLPPLPEPTPPEPEPEADTATATATGSATGALRTPAAGNGATGVPVYTVAQGDTVWNIGKRFGVREADLLALNGNRIGENGRLLAGERLVLPAGAKCGAEATSHAKGDKPVFASQDPGARFPGSAWLGRHQNPAATDQPTVALKAKPADPAPKVETPTPQPKEPSTPKTPDATASRPGSASPSNRLLAKAPVDNVRPGAGEVGALNITPTKPIDSSAPVGSNSKPSRAADQPVSREPTRLSDMHFASNDTQGKTFGPTVVFVAPRTP